MENEEFKMYQTIKVVNKDKQELLIKIYSNCVEIVTSETTHLLNFDQAFSLAETITNQLEE